MIGGMIGIRLICADPGQVLEQLRLLNIPLYSISKKGDFGITFRVAGQDLRALQTFADRKGIELSITGRRGFYWKVRSILKRKVLISGLMLILILTCWLPTRVLFIRVEGNQNVPAARILEAAENCGVYFGCARSEIRSENLKNSLLAQIPNLKWAGINTHGTTAVITVREKEPEMASEIAGGISSIVAVREGIVTSVTVTDGTGCCRVGDAVQPGQQLISGYMDCGLTIRGTRAEGEVYGLTNRQITVKTPDTSRFRVENGRVIKKYSLLFGKKRINLYKGSGIYGAGCVKMYSKYVLTLPGGFELPVAWICEEICNSRFEEETLEPADISVQMQSLATAYLKSDMIAGSIRSGDEQFRAIPGCYVFSGRYQCHEMIGRSRAEIGEYNGKSDGTDRERGSGG